MFLRRILKGCYTPDPRQYARERWSRGLFPNSFRIVSIEAATRRGVDYGAGGERLAGADGVDRCAGTLSVQEIDHLAVRHDEPFVVNQVAEELSVGQELQWLFGQISRPSS